MNLHRSHSLQAFRNQGFTLIELIIVIVVTGVIAGTITVFFKPAIDSYIDTSRRANLVDMADTALSRMARDIRTAVPNSVVSHSSQCFTLVPTLAGGRYRTAPDTVWDATHSGAAVSAYFDGTNTGITALDLFSASEDLSSQHLVIGNINTNDVYNGTNRVTIIGYTALTGATSPDNTVGAARITFAATSFPSGYDGGRFAVVSNAEQTVSFRCDGGILYRIVKNFSGVPTCPATSGGAVVARNVDSCAFVYSPNEGPTLQSGYVQMTVRLKDPNNNEVVTLTYGAHVDNIP